MTKHGPGYFQPIKGSPITLPNFIVIGGTKSGTTALFWYLAGHPEIYAGPRHHIGYFAYGLDNTGSMLYGDPELHTWKVKTREQYEELFADAGSATAIGDISPIYLETPHAAARIHEVVPEARIICSLRNPIDRAYSDYLMYLRKQGDRVDPERDLISSAEWAQPDSHWMSIGRYYEQLSRYFDLFPRKQIHILMSEDLRQKTIESVQEIYRFLEVGSDFQPDLATPHNVGGVPSNMFMERLLTNGRLRAAMKPMLPKRIADSLRRLRTSNMETPPPLPYQMRRQMTDQLEDQITKVGRLIEINLDHWLV